MAQNESDVGLQRFQGLVCQEFSESDTRAKLIDPLFKDCLGWTEDDIRREEHVHDGYLDYMFSINKTRKFIVEAKKVGKSFEIPTSFGSRNYRIGGTISTDPRIKDAMEQAQRYCVDSGVRYGVISNGHQYIMFEAFKPGSDWRDGQCVVFRSLQDIEQNFVFFWNILSKESVRNGSLRKYVSQDTAALRFIVPRETLHAKDSPITRNNLSPYLQPFVDFVLKDIIDESQTEVLEKCYVREKEFQDADLQIGRHFDRPPSFAKKYDVEIVVESATDAGSFQRLYERCEEFLRRSLPKGFLILLMGGIGSGKTTFVHHFFKFVVRNPSETVWFYVDFTKASPEPGDIEKYIYSSVIEDFERRYGDKLKEIRGDLLHFEPKPDQKDILVVFSLLARKGYTTALVLDNADQHSHVSPRYQEQVLLTANNLTDTLKTITIVTLREESFFKSTMSGVLDAFHPRVFHISSPSFEKLIRDRINYILTLLGKPDAEISDMLRRNIELSSVRPVLTMFFEIIRNSLRSSRKVGQDILAFIDEISGGNMRLALDFFNTFLVSGNTDVDEMLTIEERERRLGGIGYQIPLHHVVRSMVLEHSRLYSSSRSRIMNLFDVNPQYTISHFLHMRILNYLYDRHSYDTLHGRGFVKIDDIIRAAEELMLNRMSIEESIKKMAHFGLIEFENQSKDGYENATYVRVTNTGIYYLTQLAKKFAYLDLVWMDTPISDQYLVAKLKDCFVELNLYKSPYDLDLRFSRTRWFLDYLREMEENEFKISPEFRDSDLTRTEFLQDILGSFEQQREYIQSRRTSVVESE